jgi:hypothetical protein
MDITLYMTIIEEDSNATAEANAKTQREITPPNEDDVSLDNK